MKTKAKEILIETHNWDSIVAFWQDLGYQLEFETDHHSGRLRHPSGGPSIFVAERPLTRRGVAPIGLGALPASLLFGYVWDHFGAPRAFVMGATFVRVSCTWTVTGLETPSRS